MAKVFISYRRDDSGGFAGRLYDHTAEVVGADDVFRDIDAIPLGRDYEDEIEGAIAQCEVVLAVIGPRFLDEVNGPRLHDEADHLRQELVAALRSANTRVVPVLVGEAELPGAADLPGDLASLTTRQAFELRDGRFDSDVDIMLERVGLGPGDDGGGNGPRWLIAAAAAVVVVVIAALAVAFWPDDDTEPTTTPPAAAGAVIDAVFPPDDPPSTFDADAFVDTQPVRTDVRFQVILDEPVAATYEWFSSHDGSIGDRDDFVTPLTGACFGRAHEVTVVVEDAEGVITRARTTVIVQSAMLAEMVICPVVEIPGLDLGALSSKELVATLQEDQPELYEQLTNATLVSSAEAQLGEDAGVVLSSIYAENVAAASAQVLLIDSTMLELTPIGQIVDDLRIDVTVVPP